MPFEIFISLWVSLEANSVQHHLLLEMLTILKVTPYKTYGLHYKHSFISPLQLKYLGLNDC